MKHVAVFLSLLPVILVGAGSAFAQPNAADAAEGDSSYHRTVTFTGPGADQKSHPLPWTKEKEVSREIPTIDELADGHARADVTFVTGGVGEDDRVTIEGSKSEYNVHITNARKDGAFIGETDIIIREVAGKQEEMLEVESGPLLYVQLPPGRYVLEAAYDSETKRQEFTIGKKQRKPVTLRLIWKSVTE